MAEKASNSKSDNDKDLDDLLNSEWKCVVWMIWCVFSHANYVIKATSMRMMCSKWSNFEYLLAIVRKNHTLNMNQIPFQVHWMILMRKSKLVIKEKVPTSPNPKLAPRFGTKNSFRELNRLQNWIWNERRVWLELGIDQFPTNFQNVIVNQFRQQAKLFEERMSNAFGGGEGAPSGEQINLTFQKMAGIINFT